MNKKCLTLTEVDEICDEQEVIVEKLKSELKQTTEAFVTLKQQKNLFSKGNSIRECEKRLGEMADEKNAMEIKYNELIKTQKEALEKAEIRKAAMKERRKAAVAEIDEFIEKLRKQRLA
jgi:hypothetical protein